MPIVPITISYLTAVLPAKYVCPDNLDFRCQMVFQIIASEDIEPWGSVSLLFDDGNLMACRKSFSGEPPDAVARRHIAKGESVRFDFTDNTDDLIKVVRASE